MGAADELDREAARVRDSGVLGAAGTLLQLFEFLLTASREGSPKEIDIATTVFGKPDTANLSQDATVRVYIHRLRRKLDDYYGAAGGSNRLDIPRGSYRLCVVPQATDAAPVLATSDMPLLVDAKPSAIWRRGRFAAALAALVAANLLVWQLAWPRSSTPRIDAARASAPWAKMLANGRPVAIVVGDYYIFGEIDRKHGIDRLIRDYGINSRDDLDQKLMLHPQLRQSYVDLNLTYLPSGTAQVLRDLLPIIAHSDAERARTRVILASNLTPATLKIANIVYVGYFSGMGALLRSPVFAGSRFAVGSTWDELIDEKTGRHYHSDQGGPDQTGTVTQDFSYVSSFAGNDGNRFIVVAGTRDAALMQAAEMATNANALSLQRTRSGNADAYEALYEVEGLDRVNMANKLVVAGPLAVDRIWQNTNKDFPNE